jgi:hypothetical protein
MREEEGESGDGRELVIVVPRRFLMVCKVLDSCSSEE